MEANPNISVLHPGTVINIPDFDKVRDETTGELIKPDISKSNWRLIKKSKIGKNIVGQEGYVPSLFGQAWDAALAAGQDPMKLLEEGGGGSVLAGTDIMGPASIKGSVPKPPGAGYAQDWSTEIDRETASQLEQAYKGMAPQNIRKSYVGHLEPGYAVRTPTQARPPRLQADVREVDMLGRKLLSRPSPAAYGDARLAYKLFGPPPMEQAVTEEEVREPTRWDSVLGHIRAADRSLVQAGVIAPYILSSLTNPDRPREHKQNTLMGRYLNFAQHIAHGRDLGGFQEWASGYNVAKYADVDPWVINLAQMLDKDPYTLTSDDLAQADAIGADPSISTGPGHKPEGPKSYRGLIEEQGALYPSLRRAYTVYGEEGIEPMADGYIDRIHHDMIRKGTITAEQLQAAIDAGELPDYGAYLATLSESEKNLFFRLMESSGLMEDLPGFMQYWPTDPIYGMWYGTEEDPYLGGYGGNYGGGGNYGMYVSTPPLTRWSGWT